MFAKGDKVVTRDGVGIVTSSRCNAYTLEVDAAGGRGYYDPNECTAYTEESQPPKSPNTARGPCANSWCPSWKSYNVNEFHCSEWSCLIRTAPVA